MSKHNAPYLTTCRCCGRTTSRQYAGKHDGLCKACAEPDNASGRTPTRNERIVESGYDAYAREEGHYDA